MILDGIKYYVAGDTDRLVENESISVDVAFVPIGGVYTMDVKEAANFINNLKPKVVIPTHYGSIVGNVADGISFEKLLDSNIKCFRLLEEEII